VGQDRGSQLLEYEDKSNTKFLTMANGGNDVIAIEEHKWGLRGG
jgi:hypothetical protein